MKALLSLACIVLLAGCTSANAVTIEQSDLSLAKGKDSKTIECSDDAGSLTYTVDGTAGKIHITVTDPAETKLIDQKDVVGAVHVIMDEFHGNAGTWTLTVDRSDFSGTYSVKLAC